MKKINSFIKSVDDFSISSSVKIKGVMDKVGQVFVTGMNNSLASIDQSGNNAGKIVFMILGITIGLGVVAAVVVALKTQVTAFITKLGDAAGTAY